VGAAALPAAAGQIRCDGFVEAAMSVGGDQARTPDSPLATKSAKKAFHATPVSLVATCIAMTSRRPSALTPVATSAAALTTRPTSRTFIVTASAATNVNGPVSSRRRCRNASTWASKSVAIRDTCDLLSPVIPRVLTSVSIRRVDTPAR
jgi:hypothetical protein